MVTMPIYGKKNLYFFQNQKAYNLVTLCPFELWECGPCQVCRNYDSGLTITYFTAMSILIPNAFKWGKNWKCSFSITVKNSKWVWSGNTTITNRRQPRGTARKSRSTFTRHQEDKLSKATSSLFPIKMIAILEWTQNNVQQNTEQLKTPTMGVTINKKINNNRTTALERTAA